MLDIFSEVLNEDTLDYISKKTIFLRSIKNVYLPFLNLERVSSMEILIRASQFILSLSILIVLHELGHFIPAKLFKTKVEKFYLFFDYKFSLFKKKIGETVYGIGWIPLGGYVKIAGMIDESMDTEQMKKPAKPWEFRSKPAWQRLIIMLGGVFVNFVVGLLIYILLMYTYGEKFLPNANVKDGIWVQDSLVMNLGLKNGDKILAVDGEKIKRFNDIPMKMITANSITINRKGEIIEQKLPIDMIAQIVEKGKKMKGFIGVRLPFIVGEIPENSPNKNSGLQPNDIVVGVNEKPIKYMDEVFSELNKSKGKLITLNIKRGDETKNIEVKVNNNAKIGVILGGLSRKELEKKGYYTFEKKEYSFAQAIPRGIEKTWVTLESNVKSLGKMLDFKTRAYKGMGSFISMGSIYAPTWDWEVFWDRTALISLILGFMNLLPIPALDGGHVVFTLWEMITGRKPSDKFLEYAQVVGFLILMSLLAFAIGNDIFRHIIK